MAVCEFGIIKRLLYKGKSVPQEIMAICEFGIIKGVIGRGRTVHCTRVVNSRGGK